MHVLISQVPTVLIVVQGGPNTEKFVRSSLEHDLPVVVVKESGGKHSTATRIVIPDSFAV